MPSRRASPRCSVLSLCQEGLATVMFFLVFIYSWIFLKPFQPQLSSSLPAPMQSQALSCLCQGNRTRATTLGCGGSQPWSWDLASCCRLLSSSMLGPRPTCYSSSASREIREVRTASEKTSEAWAGGFCFWGSRFPDKGPGTPGRAGEQTRLRFPVTMPALGQSPICGGGAAQAHKGGVGDQLPQVPPPPRLVSVCSGSF